MEFLETVLSWILGQILSYLFQRAASAAKKAEEDAELDKARGLANDANVKKYEEAADRASRIDAAIDLLNRHP